MSNSKGNWGTTFKRDIKLLNHGSLTGSLEKNFFPSYLGFVLTENPMAYFKCSEDDRQGLKGGCIRLWALQLIESPF